MNYLQLCQRAVSECGVSGTLTTTAGQVGSLGRIVSWVGDAWGDVQVAHDDWEWMRSSNLLGAGISFATVAGQASYPLGTGAGTVGVTADNFGKWDRDTFRCYPASVGVAGEMFLDDIRFDVWRDAYMLGAMRSVQTRPSVAAVGPDQSLNLGPPPNALYTVTADYFTGPTVMVADTDTPTGLPSRFHSLIVYLVMQKYGSYEAAGEVLQRGVAEAGLMMSHLRNARLPMMTWTGALA